MAKINMQLLIPVVTAGWGILTWAVDRERERSKERARVSALYVNPFLSACEDLQGRLYSILGKEGYTLFQGERLKTTN